jgi:hypothetical protein
LSLKNYLLSQIILDGVAPAQALAQGLSPAAEVGPVDVACPMVVDQDQAVRRGYRALDFDYHYFLPFFVLAANASSDGRSRFVAQS